MTVFCPRSMKEYTTDDVAYKVVTYTRREWWPACERLGRPISEYRYFEDEAICFYTLDGKYTTSTPDSDDYSYWRETSEPHGHLGRTAVDYVFGTLVLDNLKSVTDKLNQLIQQEALCPVSVSA